MDFVEFKKQYEKHYPKHLPLPTLRELLNLYVAQVVVAEYQRKEMKRSYRV